jgi:hypothetical protein
MKNIQSHLSTILSATATGAHLARTLTLLLTFLLAGIGSVQAALAEADNANVPNANPGSLSGVRHLAGMPDAIAGVGRLSIDKDGIAFEIHGTKSQIGASQILKVSLGNERYLPGGEFARYVRTGFTGSDNPVIETAAASQFFAVVPFGALLEVAALRHTGQDILTVEFLDPKDGYHAAIFTLPGKQDHEALVSLLPQANSAAPGETSSATATNCAPSSAEASSVSSARPTSLALAPIRDEGTELPAEYRALIYERVIRKLKKSQPNLQVLRSGNPNQAADCSQWNLEIAATQFHKGDAVERALLGPAGLFVGTTSLQYQLQITDNRGESILDAPARTVVRGDRESLDLTKSLAASVNRKVKKLERGISN